MRLLKMSAAAFLSLILLLAAVATLFLKRPGVILTSRVAGAGVKLFGRAYAPRWSSFEFSASAAGPRRHRYVLRALDACAMNERVDACFTRLEVSVVVRWTRRGPRVETLEKLHADGGSVTISSAREGAARRPFPSAALFAIPVRSLSVKIPKLDLRAEKYALTGSLSAALAPGARRPVSFDADLTAKTGKATRRVRAALTADTDLFGGAPPTFLNALATAEVRGLGRARSDLRVRRAGSGYQGSGGLEVAPSTGPLRSARLSGCRGIGDGKAAELSCRFEAVGVRSVGALKSAGGLVRAKARVSGARLSASAQATLEPAVDWYTVSGALSATAEGRLDRPLKELALRHEARLKFEASFEKLVAFLRETPYAVPAPVHVMTGPVVLELESRGDPRSPRRSARYALTTDLAGTRQKLSARASGTVTGTDAKGRAYDHEGELVLREVALELPRLEVGPAPKITVDRRIRTEDGPGATVSTATLPAAPARAVVRSRVTIRTEKPAILFSNLAKDPVPVALELAASHPPAAASGVVGVRSFGVELFRRNATVDHLNITISSFSRVAGLEGLVIYRAPRAVISIAVLGTTERPRVELSSVPPLKREDILGLLIFGKDPEDLDPDQTASVGNTEIALESRAFGLASLYLFGSTPIEHVGYDSASKTTSVKLRLPGGANLTLGSDFDQSRQLSVRKPLAPHWAIQSEVSEQGKESRAAMTFLEWFNRY